VKHPAVGPAIDGDEVFLHFSLRFSDLRNDEMIEFGGKSSLNFGDESKR